MIPRLLLLRTLVENATAAFTLEHISSAHFASHISILLTPPRNSFFLPQESANKHAQHMSAHTLPGPWNGRSVHSDQSLARDPVTQCGKRPTYIEAEVEARLAVVAVGGAREVLDHVWRCECGGDEGAERKKGGFEFHAVEGVG